MKRLVHFPSESMGVDIIEQSRFERVMKRNTHSLTDRVFTKKEKQYPFEQWFLIFSLKESFIKLMGGFRKGDSFLNIEVYALGGNQARIRLSGETKANFILKGMNEQNLRCYYDSIDVTHVITMVMC